jgi:hypothetical protein
MWYATRHFDSDGDNSAQAMKTSPGKVYRLHVVNQNTADAYIQFFDAATASVTVGSTTPIQSYLVPGGDGTNSGALDVNLFDAPLDFQTAITYACTTTATGSTDPTTGLTVNALYR